MRVAATVDEDRTAGFSLDGAPVGEGGVRRADARFEIFRRAGVTITRHGRPVAVVVRPDTLRVRRADDALANAERVRDLLAKSRTVELGDAPPLDARRADELVAEVAASRSAR